MKITQGLNHSKSATSVGYDNTDNDESGQRDKVTIPNSPGGHGVCITVS